MAAGANGPMKYVGLTKVQVLRQNLRHKPTTPWDSLPVMLTSGCAAPISLTALSANALEAE